ncbi:MAG: hypothetical protein M1815_004045 [Lichina confinis]|nr:MAG: hypothetical protein M1815_004045 [Lichina confinis]
MSFDFNQNNARTEPRPQSDTDGPQEQRLNDTLLSRQDEFRIHRPKTSFGHRVKRYRLLRKGSIDGGYGDAKLASKRARGVAYHHLRSTGNWRWEVASFGVAIASFTGIVAMLATVNQKPVPQWPSGLSVNAILSVLVTVMKGAIGVPVAECMSQLKWSWFKQQRKLVDLSTLDDASKGVWGAIVLLFTWRRWYMAYLGAFVFLASFIIGPTIQLTVEVRVREVEIASPAASVPVCKSSYFNVTESAPDRDITKLPLSMVGAMYEGLLQTSNNNSLSPFCPSGNCTFPKYHSLGFCNECADLSDDLTFYNVTLQDDPHGNKSTVTREWCERNNRDCSVELRELGVTLDAGELIHTRPSGLSPPTVFGVEGILRGNGDGPGAPKTFSAVRCWLRLCNNTYEGAVKLGRFEERVVSTAWTDLKGDSNISGYPFPLPDWTCFRGEEKSPPYSEDDERYCAHQFHFIKFSNMNTMLTELLSGKAADFGPTGHYTTWSSQVMPALWGLFGVKKDWYSPMSGSAESVNRAMTSLADVLSNRFRGWPSTCGGASAPGTQLKDQLYLHVNWRWLVHTIVILVVSLAFFVAVVVQSSSETLWKSSIFAYFIGHPRVDGRELFAQHMLDAAQAERKVAVRPGSVPEMLHMSCERIEAGFDTATLRFRKLGEEEQ